MAFPIIINNYHLSAIRILNLHSLHFIVLSLFFLPLTISITTFIEFHFTTDFQNPNYTLKTVTSLLAFIVIAIFPAICGVALITYRTHHAILRTPLTFTSTFMSLRHSFVPLLLTFIVASFKLLPITLFITLLGLVFQLGTIKISCVLATTILFYSTVWGLAAAVVVLESRSGSEALRESKRKSDMFRFKFFENVLVTGIIMGLWLWYSAFMKNDETVTNWSLYVQVGLNYIQSAVMMLHYVVLNTVLYVRSKATHCGDVVVNREMVDVSGEDIDVELTGGFTRMWLLLYVIGFITAFVEPFMALWVSIDVQGY